MAVFWALQKSINQAGLRCPPYKGLFVGFVLGWHGMWDAGFWEGFHYLLMGKGGSLGLDC